MKTIVEYLKKEEFNIDKFIILNRENDSLVASFTSKELLKAIEELRKLKLQDDIEYWLIATINDGFYDLDDTGNYLVIKSKEINDKDDYYGINPKFNEYLR